MFSDIKERVFEAFCDLFKKRLIIHTWGNVSETDPTRQYMIITPSGLDCCGLKPDDMVVVDVNTGNSIEGHYQPSSDTPTHLELYRRFTGISGIVHTHSVNAVAFAQAGMDIPALGTTQADYFHGDIPCTRALEEVETMNDYETNTGRVIIEVFERNNCDPMSVPGCIVKNHGPFAWGVDARQALFHAEVMESVAEMDFKTLCLNPGSGMPRYLLDKHWNRKHGPQSYYGQ